VAKKDKKGTDEKGGGSAKNYYQGGNDPIQKNRTEIQDDVSSWRGRNPKGATNLGLTKEYLAGGRVKSCILKTKRKLIILFVKLLSKRKNGLSLGH